MAVHGTCYLVSTRIMSRNSERPCQLGALNAQSFVECMNSCAKLIVSEKWTYLRHELIDKLVILRMNLKFMIYCRGKRGSIGRVNEVQNFVGNDEDIYIRDYDYKILNLKQISCNLLAYLYFLCELA